jgi:hypothetical protein
MSSRTHFDEDELGDVRAVARAYRDAQIHGPHLEPAAARAAIAVYRERHPELDRQAACRRALQAVVFRRAA